MYLFATLSQEDYVPKGPSTPTRVSADIAAAAAAIAPQAHRTVTEQINHWVRIGLHVERATSVDQRRTMAVIAGEAQFSTLIPTERITAHASIDARIAERVGSDRFGPAARKAGQVTVAIDEEGKLIETAPDGTRRRL